LTSRHRNTTLARVDDKVQDPEQRFIRVPIGFPPDVHEWLRERAFRERRPMAEVVREAVRVYKDEHEPQLTLPLPR
jgi:hypothetical protein